VKKASRQIIERYYNRLTLDFHTNKRVAEEVAVIQSKRLRNKIAGFTTVRNITIDTRVLKWLELLGKVMMMVLLSLLARADS
jgi:ribosomal protein S17E